ncbi:flagellar biosynthesis protein FlhF [Candidatus Thiodiazotropha endoloripes]|uniref:flagellar biosynthesis protein FlhF n=1 Tax=Candidatus Thiodiazotropha endoloripes TaxID=1818881 RepID=UPI00083CA6A1|nr:flagellar biosynthesis protein FlhF [Candidatus Thiodiazotropha endoloripes]MCG7913656.1 flagellar biosynthesis protein FlhF [Candidatus Thiodiazotropha weberae]ODB82662.1 flagellar biosynthesis protein FlhF [Candidatus Thiodiazotropha endoloripes]
MKIRRFFASDMRQALRQVREALGADAVILSNKGVEGGVELVAAVDYDESAFNSTQPTAIETEESITQSQPAVSRNFATAAYTDIEEKIKPETDRVKPKADYDPEPPLERPRVEWSQDPVLREMRQEMQALRRMMENELSELTWRDLGHRRPQTQELIRQLMGLGLDAAHCRELAYRAEDAESPEQAWHQALNHLRRELSVESNDLLNAGGVLALVGPTGVGKTTTIAKLAAKFCLRHGNRHLALISADSYRIGAQEQLQNYGQILDVPVRSAATAEELSSALHAFSEKRLVLIDTAGMGQRDLKLTERLGLLKQGNHPVKALLTLSATTQRRALSHAIRSFGAIAPIGAILTKMDEAASLGGVVSALLESRLPLAFTTNGQRVPEDIQVARAEQLIRQAVEMTQQTEHQPDEEYLAMAFGGTSEHANV